MKMEMMAICMKIRKIGCSLGQREDSRVLLLYGSNFKTKSSTGCIDVTRLDRIHYIHTDVVCVAQ